MNTADALTDVSGILVPPDSMRAGRRRTWSASDLPQLTQLGVRCSAAPSPSVAKTFDDRPGIAQAAHVSEPRAL